MEWNKTFFFNLFLSLADIEWNDNIFDSEMHFSLPHKLE